jgi:hypothetical protein
MTATSRIRVFVFAFSLAALGACSAEKEAPPPISRRQSDSLIGASSLPGAQGAKGALAGSDSAARRKAVLDSIARADSL